MRNYMLKSVEIERAVAPIIAQCLDGIEKAANEINEKKDTLLVIERYKSGFQPPGDFPFEDLSVAKTYDSNSQLSQPVMQPIHNHHLTVKGTVSGSKIKKRVGLFGIFSSNKVNVVHNILPISSSNLCYKYVCERSICSIVFFFSFSVYKSVRTLKVRTKNSYNMCTKCPFVLLLFLFFFFFNRIAYSHHCRKISLLYS